MDNNKNILVTGAAGFIGYHLCRRLCEMNFNVIGLDSINNYYDQNLKFDRLQELGIARDQAINFNELVESNLFQNNFSFIRLKIEDRENIPNLFKNYKFEVVVNLAAQAGVRYSIENPEAYIDSNVVGFLNILECCRNYNCKRLLYASSSSVYGNSENIPFNEEQSVDKPVSIYAATKKSNELMAHTYSHLFNIETIGLRFFTVYGPWGRPDMAMFLFTDAIINNRPINVFNNGNLSRDFTYIDDIIEGLMRMIGGQYKKRAEVYNIGNSKPVKLLNFIEEIENTLNKKTEHNMLPMQEGDVSQTYADVTKLRTDYAYEPSVSVQEGVTNFINWYKKYYGQ